MWSAFALKYSGYAVPEAVNGMGLWHIPNARALHIYVQDTCWNV